MKKPLSSFFDNKMQGSGALTHLMKRVDLLEKRVIILEQKLKGVKK